MSDLLEFLAARLDEDEAEAREALALWDDALEIIAFQRHHDPARVLREVAAKRAILELHEAAAAELDDSPGDPKVFGWARAAEIAVRDLVAVYSDHPDYDPAWADYARALEIHKAATRP